MNKYTVLGYLTKKTLKKRAKIRFCHMAVDVKTVVCYLAKRLSIKGHIYSVLLLLDLIKVLTHVGKSGYRREKLDMVFLISMTT